MRINLVRGQTDNTVIQLFRYFFAGGVAFLVDFGALVLLVEVFQVHYLAAAALACALGTVANYSLSILWVFNKRALKSPAAEFAVFALLGLAGIGLKLVLMYALTDLIGFHYLASKILSTAAIFFWNFGSKKTLLFSARPNADAACRPSPQGCPLPEMGLAE
jgi:putative flippase GtrA